MRRYLTLLGLAAAIVAPVAAHADTLDFNLIVTSCNVGPCPDAVNSVAGTGSLSFNAPLPQIGKTETIPLSALASFGFTFDGQNFSASSDTTTTPTITIDSNGNLVALDYTATLVNGVTSAVLQFGDFGSLSFFAQGSPGFQEDGDISVVPEPSTLALLGSGLLGVAGVIRRKMIA